jgi:hypothetical protein
MPTFAVGTVALNGASIALGVLQFGQAFAKCAIKKSPSLKPGTTAISSLAFASLNSLFKNHENPSCHCFAFHASIGLQ